MPQLYLRNFAADDRRLTLVDRDDITVSYSTTVRKALAEVGFYRLDPSVFDVADEQERPHPEVVEEHLSKLERAAAPGIYKLVRTGLRDLTREDWYHLVNFVALQTVRGNRFREDIGALGTHAARIQLGETLGDDQIAKWLEDLGEQPTAEAVSDFRERLVGSQGPRLVPTKEMLIQESLKLALGGLAERLADGMQWSVVDPSETTVLTSDEPVCWWAPGDEPVGFASARVVWMPVARNRILQMVNPGETPASLGLPDPAMADERDELVRFINGQIATQAHRWIVHHPDDHPLDDIELGPRTAWGNQLVAVEEDGSTRREIYMHRRLPVKPPNQG